MRKFIAAAAVFCLPAVAQGAASSRFSAEADVRGRIAEQTAAWNRGDIDGALGAYCPSEDIVWTSKAGLSRGYAAFADDMRASFGGGAQGVMKNDILYAAPFGEAVLVTLRWSVERDGARILGGVSTQIWSPCAGALRVVYEHAS